MISDRDRTFTRSVWHELVKLSDTTPKSSYHSGLAGWRDGRALARGPAFPLPLPAAAGGAHAKRRDGCAARAGKDGRWRARRDWAGCCVSSVGAARMDMHGWGKLPSMASRLVSPRRLLSVLPLPASTTTRHRHGPADPTATRTDRERERERGVFDATTCIGACAEHGIERTPSIPSISLHCRVPVGLRPSLSLSLHRVW